MRCEVINTFNRRGEPQLPGSIIDVPEDMFLKLAGYVKAITTTSTTSVDAQTFEQTGDPVSCRFWFQICWSCKLYFDQCTRNSSCKVYKFLERNT